MVNAIVNNANTTVFNRFDGARWNGSLIPFATAISANSDVCTELGGGSFKGSAFCLLYGLDGVFFAVEFKGGIWQNSDWLNFGAISAQFDFPRTSCGLLSSGSITCTWINYGDSLLYENTFNGSNWIGETKIGGPSIIGGPACTALASGKVMCVVVGLNNQAMSVTGP
jgi:hypothetical protein